MFVHQGMSTHRLRIEVRLPDGHWAGDVTRANPTEVLRIEKHMPLSRGRGTARISGGPALYTSIGAHPKIEALRKKRLFLTCLKSQSKSAGRMPFLF